MEVAGDNVFELEDVSTIKEALLPVVRSFSVTRQKLLELYNPKASIARTGAK